MKGRTIIQLVLSGIMIAIVVGYSGFVLYDYLRGPRIVISSPESGFSTTTSIVNVVGRAVHASALTINDEEMPTDLDGNFQSRLILAEGYNIMKVAVLDHYGRTVEKIIELTLMPQAHSIMSTTTATTTVNY